LVYGRQQRGSPGLLWVAYSLVLTAHSVTGVEAIIIYF